MTKATTVQTGFNGGEYSPFLRGQINLEKRLRGETVELCQNMLPLKQGAAIRRGGTKFIKEIKDSSKQTELIEFISSSDNAYTIEVGDSYFRFLKDNSAITLASQNITAITQANPAVVTYSGADTFSNGSEVYIASIAGMTQINGLFYKVANVNTGANTFELTDLSGNNINSTNFTAYTSGGTVAQVYEIASPYAQADLFDSDGIFKIQYLQSADVLYLFHSDYQTRSLSRISDSSWSLATVAYEDGPFLDTNATTTTFALSGTSGSVTVTASAITGINNDTGFQTTDVGRIIRFKDPASNWTWLTITARASTTSVTATISGANASAGTATVNWRLGIWSETTGYPKAAFFFQDRICAGGAETYPDKVGTSKSGGYGVDYFLCSPTEANGTVNDDNGIVKTLPSKQVNAIQWMAADATGLILGTTGQEWVIRASANNEVITPSNAKPDPVSSIKSASIQPVLAESGLIFIQKARRKVFDMTYSYDLDRLKPRDLTLVAEHITKSQVTSMAYQQEPINTVWQTRTDGVLIGQTYYPDENVFGWHRHIIGGSFGSGNAVVESIVVTPSPNGSSDQLTMIVKRTINSVTKRYIEYMTQYYEDETGITNAFQVDCGLTYDGASTSTVKGLNHLKGQTVKVMVDGKSHPDLIVGTLSDGSIGVTLANNVSGSKIHIGLRNVWAIKLMEVEAGGSDGPAQGKTKRIQNIVLKLLNTLGLSYGTESGTKDELTINNYTDYDETPTLFSGNTKALAFPNGYDQEGQVYLTGDGVFPACILAIIIQLVTQDR